MSQQERLQYLFNRCMNEAATPEEREELQELIKLPQHEQIVRSLINTAISSETEYSLPASSENGILTAIFNAPSQRAIPIRTNKIKRFVRYAIAALFTGLIAGSVYLFLFAGKADTKQSPKDITIAPTLSREILPGTDQAILTLADGKTIVLNSNDSMHLANQSHAVIINLKGQLVYKLKEGPADQMAYNTITVPRKGQYQLVLSDGTEVWLNAESSLRFPVAFTGKERTVELTGEGYFEIAKDRERPFHVKAHGVDVQALGTHFNVMAYDNDALKTTLLEGSVLVTYGTSSGILKPGQQLMADQKTNSLLRSEVDVDEVIAWKEGYFLFNNKTPLNSVMNQLERWYDIEVNYEGAVPQQNFGGGIQRSLPLSGVLSVLKQSGIRFKEDGKNLIILK